MVADMGLLGWGQWPRKASSSQSAQMSGSTLASSTSGRSGDAQPVAHAVEVGDAAGGQPAAARRLGERREVRRRELGEVDGRALRPEVVHLGAVGRVVVDHDEQRQAEPPERLELGQRHQRAAVAERRHGQPAGPREGRADRVAQSQADALEGLREHEARRVGHAQVHRRPAHEVARVDDDRALLGQQRVERDAERARVEAVRALRERLVAPAAAPELGRQLGAAPAGARGDGLEQRRRGGGGVADDAGVEREVRAERVRVEVHLDDARARADERAVPRRPLVQRGPEGHDDVGLGEQPGGERGGEAAGDAEVERVAAEEAVGHRGRREQRAGALAERAQRRPGAGEDRAAPGDEHRPLGTREEVGDLCHRAGGRAGRQRRHGRARAASAAPSASASAAGSSAACTSSGAMSTTARRSTRARRTARATSATAVPGPWTRSATAPTERTSAAWSMRKFERIAAAGVSAATSTSGVRLLAASVSPVIAFVSPGPWCTLHAATVPLTRA